MITISPETWWIDKIYCISLTDADLALLGLAYAGDDDELENLLGEDEEPLLQGFYVLGRYVVRDQLRWGLPSLERDGDTTIIRVQLDA